MSRWNERFLGVSNVPPELGADELEEYFRLSAAEVSAIQADFRPQFRIAVAIQLGFMRMSGGKLEAFTVLPRDLLKFVGEQVGERPPSIASLKTLYKRRQTRWQHQDWVMRRLKVSTHGKQQERLLFSALKEASKGTASVERLMTIAREWLFGRLLVIPPASTIRDICVRAASDTEQAIYDNICRAVPKARREQWAATIMSARPDGHTVLEWLQRSPKRRSKKNLNDLFDRIAFLREMGVGDIDLSLVPNERLLGYCLQLQHRRPARFKVLEDFNRTLQLVSFLRVTLGRATDMVIELARKATSDIYGRAGKAVQREQGETIAAYREVWRDVVALAQDDSISPKEAIAKLRAVVSEFTPTAFATHAAAVRDQLVEPNPAIRSLVKKLTELGIGGTGDSRATAGLKVLGDLYKKKKTSLPKGDYDVSKVWEPLIAEEDDREVALRALEVSTLRELHKGLRGGSCWVDYSMSYRDRDHILIPEGIWEAQRGRHYGMLRLPQRAKDYLEPLIKGVEQGLKRVAEAHKAGELTVDDGDIHLPKMLAEEIPSEVGKAQSALAEEIGDIQLPEILLQMDVATRFSRALLGRMPASERELLLTYAAVLAHGTDMTAAGVARMIPGLTPVDISAAMQRLEFDDALGKANRQVLTYIERLPIVSNWADGKGASADMMSLSTSQHLWNTRIDPRRQTPSIGVYTHVHDRWPILNQMPFVLGERQAGAAIEGVIRQLDVELERLAVDTHGYTDMAMAVSKCLGFDLCPRLKNLRERRLCVPRGMEVPEALLGVTDSKINTEFIEEAWDGFVRLVASISNGTTSAVLALRRFGSDASGDPIYRAGKHLGRLVRTLFLCEYFTNPAFRREQHRLLNRGEHVHTLERAIYMGEVPHQRGRRSEELVAITGSLTLLCNLVIGWNAAKIQEALASLENRGITFNKDIMRHVSPVKHAHINFRGTFRFPIEKYGARLLFDGASLRRTG